MIIMDQSGSRFEILRPVPSFRGWQGQMRRLGLLPVIGITGTRGKSTVLRMLDSIFQYAHLRTATWSDLGVEIRGRRQRGELSAWSKSLARLSESTLDVAIQELHWSTINAVGLPRGSYPVMAMTNLLSRTDAATHGMDMRSINRAALRVINAVHLDGTLVIYGDDPALASASSESEHPTIVTSLSRRAPTLSEHIENGDLGVWIANGTVTLGTEVDAIPICAHNEILAGPGESVSFETANAMTAVALATAVGIDLHTIVHALRDFQIAPDVLPGSFNMIENGHYRAVIDRLAPPEHVRSILRAANPENSRRQISVIGDLSSLQPRDAQELGRLVGRAHGAVVLHSNERPDLIDRFRKGIASNDYPPLFIQLPTERRALNRALQTVSLDNVVVVLGSGDFGPAIRAIQRHSL